MGLNKYKFKAFMSYYEMKKANARDAIEAAQNHKGWLIYRGYFFIDAGQVSMFNEPKKFIFVQHW